MVINSDAINNYFIGDCSFANHYPGEAAYSFFKGQAIRDLNVDLASMMTSLSYEDVSISGTWSTFAPTFTTQFTFPGDPKVPDSNFRRNYISFSADDMYTRGDGVTSSVSLIPQIRFLLEDNTNENFYLLGSDTPIRYHPLGQGIGATGFPYSWRNAGENFKFEDPTLGTTLTVSVCADAKSFGIYVYGGAFDDKYVGGTLYYWGIVDNLNTTNNYYDLKYGNGYVFICCQGISDGTTTDTACVVQHWIKNEMAIALATGDAQYSIVCSDAQTPTGNWASDCIIFDDDATLGYPAIGKAPNILLADGTYTYGEIVKITGGVTPDAGQNSWIAVGECQGKTLLFRCYTSS